MVLDSMPSEEFSQEPFLPDKKSELWDQTIFQVKKKIYMKNQFKEQSS